MQLKRLEAYGFKSFADKIDVDFDNGITAIVGPNGSGKSNITDAIRWVLGEQNVRNLRGVKAEDVIFTGSASRKAMGVAEVSLIFDNDGTLPVDFREVVVTRRLFRNGDSEFYINKSRCRLKDIANLFADTGLGHDGMGIIGQNKIDEILNARPEERRLFFEEAAGITKYRNRKRESLRKLDDTESNLTRVNDIIGEIENQLEPLRISAEKTARYNELVEENKTMLLAELHHRYLKLEKSIETQEQELRSAHDQEQAAKTSLQLIENRKEQIDHDLLAMEQQLTELATQRSSLKDRIAEGQQEIQVLVERRSNGKENIQRLHAQRDELEQLKKHAEKEIQRLQELKKEKHEQQERLTAKIDKNRIEAKKIRSLVIEKRANLQKQEKSLQEDNQIYIAKQGELKLLQRDIDADSENRENRQQRLDELAVEIKRMSDSQTELLAKKRAEDKELNEIANNLKDNKTKAESIYNFRRSSEQEQNQLQSQLQADTSRLQVMEKLQSSFEGFGKAAKVVLKSQAYWRKGICGAVAQLLNVPSQYVTAVEIALGGALQNIVTEDTATAKNAIEYLKKTRSGRVTFLPLSSIEVRHNPEKDKFSQGGACNGNSAHSQGVIGWADEIIAVEEKYKKIAQFLLGRTLVVNTLDNALIIAKEHNQRLRIVTLEGELISPGGALAGGSQQHKEASFLNRSEEIRQLKEKVTKLQTKLNELRSSFEQQTQELAHLTKEAEQKEQRQHELEVSLAQYAVHLGTARGELDKLKKEQLELQGASEQADVSFAQLHNKATRMKQELKKLQDAIDSRSEELSQVRQSCGRLEDEAEELAEATRDMEVKEANLKNEALSAHNQILLHQQSVTRNSEALTKNQADENELMTQLQGSSSKMSDAEAKIKTLQEQYDTTDKAHRSCYEQRMTRLADSKKNDEAARDANHKLTGIQNAIHQQELAISKVEFDINQCQEEMLHDYGLVPERVVEVIPELDEAELKRAKVKLEKELAVLGTVNPNAPEEYAELNNRHDFMTGQANDLVEAKENLQSILQEMDNTMTKQFNQAFAKISEYFQDIFVRLFGGGQANIRLTDKENVLESGVDISVQLPEKKRQNLSVLSGGERALTVVALLFSFLRYRPAPFSVLDEIDAPLDEANISRFGKFLQEYATNTQFIIVTHRKGTMEAADTMYGVTIEDAGVSKVLSVKLNEVEM